MMYDTTQPRLAITSLWPSDTGEPQSREIGQAFAYGEALFWLKCGYKVEVSRWNGKFFESSENYFPDDL